METKNEIVIDESKVGLSNNEIKRLDDRVTTFLDEYKNSAGNIVSAFFNSGLTIDQYKEIENNIRLKAGMTELNKQFNVPIISLAKAALKVKILSGDTKAIIWVLENSPKEDVEYVFDIGL